MLRKIASEIMLILIVLSTLTLAFNIQPVKANDSWAWVTDTVTGAYGEAVVGTGTALYIARDTRFYRYMPTDNSFVELAGPPKPDGYAFKTGTALAWDFSDYIYALYGAATDESRRWFCRYSVSNNSWEALADTPADQGEGDAMTFVARDGIYATIGGEQRPTYFVRYDPSTNSWSDAHADLPAGMGDGSSLVWAYGDFLYALRGEFYEKSPLCDFWRYSLRYDAWESMEDIPADAHSGGVGGVGDGGSLLYIGFWLPDQRDYIYALSGNQAHPEKPVIPDKRFYRYTISTNSWELLADLPFGIGYYVGCRLGYADGHVYAWQGTPGTWAGGGDDLARYKFTPTLITDVPLFELLDKEVTEFQGGVNVTLTFRNYGFNATNGTVWMPWEKVWYWTPLCGSPPTGNITENLLPFDVNGDGDASDVFVVHYIDNKTVEVNGVKAYALFVPEQRIHYDEKGIYDVLEKNSFKLGSKNHTLHKVSYMEEYEYGYAGFGIDSFFRYHSSPNIQFVIEQVGASVNSASTAEIVSMKLNGTFTPYEFNFIVPWLDGPHGQWYVDNVYVYPLDFLNSKAVFTVQLSIRGEPGSYLLMTILNWAPNDLHRYRYFVFDALEIPFAITGTVHREVSFGDETYRINILTNSTISQTITFNWTAKEISFNAAYYGGSTFFWNVTVPQNLLKGMWNVTLNGSPISFTPTTNSTHTFIYFNSHVELPWFTTSQISITATWVPSDTFPPYIGIPSRDPAGDVLPYQLVKVSVNVTDEESGIKNVTLCYAINGGLTVLINVTMIYNSTTGLYEATIPGQPAGTWVKYQIIVCDIAENQAVKDETEPYCMYQVIPEFLSSTILLLFIALFMLAVVLAKRRFPRKLKSQPPKTHLPSSFQRVPE
ncbi:MAG: hypothetical protein QMD23_02370 [Candidatus Bathyarchaeia archaeon]|nr:hypothetical protein [Candidatus Bathyarchaeia archaeon]